MYVGSKHKGISLGRIGSAQSGQGGMLVALAYAPLAFSSAPNKYAAKFDSMVAACTLPDSAVEFIDDRKQRVLFRGVAAAAKEPVIRNAFSIVYQDLGPVRVAGDLIFSAMDNSDPRTFAVCHVCNAIC